MKTSQSRILRVAAVIIVAATCLFAAQPAALAQQPGALGQQLNASPQAPAYTPGAAPSDALGSQSDADIWRALKGGRPGDTVVKSPEAAVLINPEGEWWRQIRQPGGPLIFYAGWTLAAILGAVALFFVVRGRIRIADGRSGRTIQRFNLAQRIAHWVIAVLFLLLGFSGLLLLFGRPFLIPLI